MSEKPLSDLVNLSEPVRYYTEAAFKAVKAERDALAKRVERAEGELTKILASVDRFFHRSGTYHCPWCGDDLSDRDDPVATASTCLYRPGGPMDPRTR